MKIVIAGGSGLLGKALSAKLVNEGHDVVILSRNPDRISWQVPGTRLVTWSTESLEGWASELNGSDVVINLAGVSIAGNRPWEMRWTKRRKQAIRDSRVKAGKALTKAVALSKNKPGLFIQSSAIGAYGPSSKLNLDENSPLGNDFLSSVTKEWEDSSTEIGDLGVRRIILRTGLVLTREGGLLPLLMLPFYFLAGGPIGTGKQYMSWIHIDDWIGAVNHLINDPKSSGVFNLTAEQPVTNEEFAKTLGRTIKRPSFLKTPGIALRIALGESSTLALDGQHVIPAKLKQSGYQFQFSSVRESLNSIVTAPLTFRSQFQVKAGIQDVSEYHSDTSVLRRLTPFPIHVAFKHVEAVREGSTAEFTLWFGPIPVGWKARHYSYKSPHGFIDEQVEGPFTSWVHQHSFIPLKDKGTRIQDEIHFVLGKRGTGWLMSRFMWLTLPILFSFRAWRTKRDLRQVQNRALAQERRSKA